jgi:hypothetical protein
LFFGGGVCLDNPPATHDQTFGKDTAKKVTDGRLNGPDIGPVKVLPQKKTLVFTCRQSCRDDGQLVLLGRLSDGQTQ